MARQKNNNFIEVFKLFFTSIKTYFLYLDQCAKYLAFPIFGQLISLFILFAITYYFNTNIENIRNFNPFFQSDTNLLTAFFIILTPFLIVLICSIYKYIIAFESLNILFYTVSPNKKVKNIDFKANDKCIERRLFGYIVLMFIITILLITPPLIFISPIIWLFFCLAFQVYALENNSSPFSALSRSSSMVKSNILPVILMLVGCTLITYIFLPNLFIWALDKISVTHFFINISIPFIDILHLENYSIQGIGNILPDSVTLAKCLVESCVSFIIIGFTLPFRCCCFTQMYKLFDSEKIKEFSKESDEIIKRAAGKKR